LIAHKAGVSVKTVERLLVGFEQLALIKIDRNDVAGVFKAPNTYTLLPIRHCDASMRHHGQQASMTDKVEESGRILEKSQKKHTHSAVFSANGLTEDQKQIIAHFNETFVPHGFLPVEKITKATRAILERKDCTLERFDELLNDQAAWPHKRTFYKLFHTRTGAERLASKSNEHLQLLRSKLIAARNSRNLSCAEMDATREQLKGIKQILKGRGIQYPASL
jgi:hypothetical protein